MLLSPAFQFLTHGLFLSPRNLTTLTIQVAVTAMLASGDPAHPDKVAPRTARDWSVDAGAFVLAAALGALILSVSVDDAANRMTSGQVATRGSAKSGMWGSTCGDGSQRPGSRPRACSVAPCLQGHGSPPGQVSAAWRFRCQRYPDTRRGTVMSPQEHPRSSGG